MFARDSRREAQFAARTGQNPEEFCNAPFAARTLLRGANCAVQKLMLKGVTPDVLGISRALYLSPEIVKEGLKEKGKLPGFHLSFLEAKAKEHAAVGDWKTICALIAAGIYGVILFPNQKSFVDHNAIRLFMQRNPIPTLIGDVYYSVHNKNEKRRGGLIRCCAQLLFRWFMGYLPSRGAFAHLDPSVKWSFRSSGLH
ncbi:hypothetical protein KIW84_065353 [Lathyrus oleraceus]|uniref:DUF7745 domain-containing protein n=1 Tax=Pisum sativum TaxID=3888 RepID=A0A9D5AA96_PEA|nr:hypothetical protein KIW84_065353 [Pisum sativum]